MKFTAPLIEATFLKRYKRFLADVRLDDEVIQVHVPNTGSLKSVIHENAKCWISKSPNKNRKLAYSLEAIQTPQGWAGVNTNWPNKLAFEAWTSNKIKHWKNWDHGFSECKINAQSRIDLVLSPHSHKPSVDEILKADVKYHFIEVKNVSWLDEDHTALFPDAVTSRGLKHIDELINLKSLGHSAEMFYVIQRESVKNFRTAQELDSKYASSLTEARKKGVQVSAWQSCLTQNSIELTQEVPIQMGV